MTENQTIPEQVREGGEATIVRHIPGILGLREARVQTVEARRFWIDAHQPRGAWSPVTVTVEYLNPRKWRFVCFSVLPKSTQFLTIEAKGQVVYDSRLNID